VDGTEVVYSVCNNDANELFQIRPAQGFSSFDNYIENGNDLKCYNDGRNVNQCLDECAANGQCLAVIYINKGSAWGDHTGCCLKGARTDGNFHHGITLYTKLDQPYVDVNANGGYGEYIEGKKVSKLHKGAYQYGLVTHYAEPGNDLGFMNGTLNDCITSCNGNPKCTSFNFVPTGCYLKNARGPGTKDNHSNYYAKKRDQRAYGITENFDGPYSNDLAFYSDGRSLSQCSDECSSNSSCIGFNFNKSVCRLKGGGQDQFSKIPNSYIPGMQNCTYAEASACDFQCQKDPNCGAFQTFTSNGENACCFLGQNPAPKGEFNSAVTLFLRKPSPNYAVGNTYYGKYTMTPNQGGTGIDLACYVDGRSVGSCLDECNANSECKALIYILPGGVWGKASGCCLKGPGEPIIPWFGLNLYTKSPVGPQEYRQLCNKLGKCLATPADNPHNGIGMIQWDANGANGQLWRLQNGQLCNKLGKCLATPADNPHNGIEMIQWDANGAKGQLWTLQNGQLCNKLGKCLATPHDNPHNGIGMIQWDANGAKGQLWNFVTKTQ
jgi:hypothetical protein